MEPRRSEVRGHLQQNNEFKDSLKIASYKRYKNRTKQTNKTKKEKDKEKPRKERKRKGGYLHLPKKKIPAPLNSVTLNFTHKQDAHIE